MYLLSFLPSFSHCSGSFSRLLCHLAWEITQPQCSLNCQLQEIWYLWNLDMGKSSQTMLITGKRMGRSWHLSVSCKKVFKLNCSKVSAFLRVAVFPDEQINIKWRNTWYLGSVLATRESRKSLLPFLHSMTFTNHLFWALHWTGIFCGDH